MGFPTTFPSFWTQVDIDRYRETWLIREAQGLPNPDPWWIGNPEWGEGGQPPTLIIGAPIGAPPPSIGVDIIGQPPSTGPGWGEGSPGDMPIFKPWPVPPTGPGWGEGSPGDMPPGYTPPGIYPPSKPGETIPIVFPGPPLKNSRTLPGQGLGGGYNSPGTGNGTGGIGTDILPLGLLAIIGLAIAGFGRGSRTRTRTMGRKRAR